LLGHIVYRLLIAPKRDRAALIARKDQLHRQIRGRQIQLLKASPEAAEVSQPEKQPVDDATLSLLFPYLTINS